MLTPRCRSERRRVAVMPKLLPLAAALLIAQAAHAQAQPEEQGQSSQSSADSQQTKDLETVEVTGARVKIAEIGGYASTLRETPQTVTVIDRAQLDAQNLFTLDDVMMKTPGVVVMQETTDEHYYYIRGQEVNSFQWDGITMESFAWLNTSPNMAMFEQVQVLRGANGVLNAAKSFGSVNLIRKRPLDYFKASVGLSYGSWNNLNTDIDVTGPLTESGRLRGRAVVSYGDRDYSYDIASRTEKLVYAALEYDITPDTLFTLTANDHHVSSTPFVYGMPRYSDGSSLGLPRSTFFGADWNRYKVQTSNIFASVEHKFENGWLAKFAATSLDSSSKYKYAYVYGSIDRDAPPGRNAAVNLYGNESDYMFRQHAADVSVQGRFEMFGRTHDLLLGSSYYVNYYGYGINPLDAQIEQEGGVDLHNFDPRSVAEPAWRQEGTPWTLVGRGWRDDWKGVYGTMRFHFSDNLTLTAGARATWFTHQFQTGAYDADLGRYSYDPKQDTKENAIITPYAGLVWDINDTFSAYASYADIFTPATEQTFGRETLDPVIGANYEVGVKAELLGGRVNASLATFRVDKTNEAMVDPRYPEAEYGQTYYLSSGKTRSKGYELEVTGKVNSNWTIAGGYTRNTTENIRADEDVGLPYATWVPKDMLRLWTDYTLPFGDKRWSIGGNIDAQSEVVRPSFVQGRGPVDIRQGGFAILGLRIGYQLSDSWKLGLNVNNLTDRTYYPKTGSSIYCCNMYAAPRNVMLTLRGDL